MSKIILKDENLTDLWKKLRKEILFEYYVFEKYKISEESIVLLVLKFLIFLKGYREKLWHFPVDLFLRIINMSLVFSLISWEAKKLQNNWAIVFQNIQIIYPSAISFISQSNLYCSEWSWTIFHIELIELQDKVFSVFQEPNRNRVFLKNIQKVVMRTIIIQDWIQ